MREWGVLQACRGGTKNCKRSAERQVKEYYWNSVGPQGERRGNASFIMQHDLSMTERHSLVLVMFYHYYDMGSLGRLPRKSIVLLYTTFLMQKTMSWVIYDHLTHSFWSNTRFGWKWPVLEFNKDRYLNRKKFSYPTNQISLYLMITLKNLHFVTFGRSLLIGWHFPLQHILDILDMLEIFLQSQSIR